MSSATATISTNRAQSHVLVLHFLLALRLLTRYVRLVTRRVSPGSRHVTLGSGEATHFTSSSLHQDRRRRAFGLAWNTHRANHRGNCEIARLTAR